MVMLVADAEEKKTQILRMQQTLEGRLIFSSLFFLSSSSSTSSPSSSWRVVGDGGAYLDCMFMGVFAFLIETACSKQI